MILQEVVLKKESNLRKLIEERVGSSVIIKDDHLLWQHGKILNADDTQRYQIELYNAKGKTEMWYDDILQLIDVYKDPTPNLQLD